MICMINLHHMTYTVSNCFQNLGEIPNLHGLEEDQSLDEEMSLKILGYKAFRYVNISFNHSSNII